MVGGFTAESGSRRNSESFGTHMKRPEAPEGRAFIPAGCEGSP